MTPPAAAPPPLPSADAPAAGEEDLLAGLVERMRHADAAALAEFHARTLPVVYGIALRVLRLPAEAEEVCNDVYLQAWDQAAAYSPGRGAVLAWLRTLAWSRTLDRARRLRRQGPVADLHPEALPGAYTAGEDAGPGPEHTVEQVATAQRLAAALATLGPAQRRVLTLMFRQEMSHAEIARHTGLPLGTVKSHARRGLAALRAALPDGSELP